MTILAVIVSLVSIVAMYLKLISDITTAKYMREKFDYVLKHDHDKVVEIVAKIISDDMKADLRRARQPYRRMGRDVKT